MNRTFIVGVKIMFNRQIYLSSKASPNGSRLESDFITYKTEATEKIRRLETIYKDKLPAINFNIEVLPEAKDLEERNKERSRYIDDLNAWIKAANNSLKSEEKKIKAQNISIAKHLAEESQRRKEEKISYEGQDLIPEDEMQQDVSIDYVSVDTATPLDTVPTEEDPKLSRLEVSRIKKSLDELKVVLNLLEEAERVESCMTVTEVRLDANKKPFTVELKYNESQGEYLSENKAELKDSTLLFKIVHGRRYQKDEAFVTSMTKEEYLAFQKLGGTKNYFQNGHQKDRA